MANVRRGKTTGLTVLDFLTSAIKAIERATGYRGAHTVYQATKDVASINQALMAEFAFSKADAISATQTLVRAGKLLSLPVKGGVRLYTPDNPPERSMVSSTAKVAALVDLMGGKDA